MAKRAGAPTAAPQTIRTIFTFVPELLYVQKVELK